MTNNSIRFDLWYLLIVSYNKLFLAFHRTIGVIQRDNFVVFDVIVGPS